MNRFLFLFANITDPPENGFGLPGCCGLASSPGIRSGAGDPGPRTRRMSEGIPGAGEAGRTFTERWGDAPIVPPLDTAVETLAPEEVDDALECECLCRWTERTDDTLDDVDFLPRRPDERRIAVRGVSGADGDRLCRL